jgi:monoamine oxidase
LSDEHGFEREELSMTDDSRTYDAIVIGAGFAGVTAARDLGTAGRSVLLLEARDRLGGRTWYRAFPTTKQNVEIGGTWVAPRWQPHVGGEIERYGMDIVESPAPERFAWSLAGDRTSSPLPIPVEEWLDFERAIVHIDTSAARIRFGTAPLDQEGLEDLDVPFEEWLNALRLPRKTREFLLAWASFYFGNHPSQVSALHILSWVAGFGNSAVGWYVGVSEKLSKGTRGLIEVMSDDSKAEIRLDSPVDSIGHAGETVTVTTRAGDSYSASAVVLATPLNTWSDISFSPALSKAKAAAAGEKHAGQSVKVWALVKNVEGNFYGVGWDTALKWVATEYTVAEGSLLVGFGCSPDDLDVTNSDEVARAIKEFLPDAEVVATDSHDWNADEFSQGTWMAYRPGQVMRFATALQEAEGRVAFAGSDLASGWTGWIDGAIESGARAVRDVESILAGASAPVAAKR